MFFNNFLHIVAKLKLIEVSGSESHAKIMDLKIRKEIYKDANHNNTAKDSSVLCLVYPDKNNLAKTVFILRKIYKGYHSGQISFPGGKAELQDKSAFDTALREANEEVGINPSSVQLIKKLSPVYIPVSNYKVQAFLSYTNITPDFIKQEEEVEEILEFPLADFLNNPTEAVNKTYNGKTYTTYSFRSGNWKIWGATAMILSEITDMINIAIKN